MIASQRPHLERSHQPRASTAHRALALSLLAAATACGDDPAGASTAAAPNITAVREPPGANCPHGGVKVTIDGDDPVYVCDGADGSTGSSGSSSDVEVEPIPDDDGDSPCGSGGGVRITVTTDGETHTSYVCHGGGDAVEVTRIDDEGGCNSGLRVTLTPIQGEPEVHYVCDGDTLDAQPADSATCPAGGTTVSVGDSSAFSVCNGQDGDALLFEVELVGPGQDLCIEGGYVLIVGGEEQERHPLCIGGRVACPIEGDWIWTIERIENADGCPFNDCGHGAHGNCGLSSLAEATVSAPGEIVWKQYIPGILGDFAGSLTPEHAFETTNTYFPDATFDGNLDEECHLQGELRYIVQECDATMIVSSDDYLE